MQDYQKEFLRFAFDTGVLRFGEFTLKSGRKSPYFFNAGLFDTGAALARLGRFYASAIAGSGLSFDLLYGPAYKGIPLAASTVIALADQYQRDIPYAFNRKESKDHGEGGTIVGHALTGNILIIDDVITAGTSIRESVDIIEAQGAEAVGVIIALDRQEKGRDDRSAVQQVQEELGIPVFSIITLADLVSFLEESPGDQDSLKAVRDYQERYGI